jgi:hypothetical protein
VLCPVAPTSPFAVQTIWTVRRRSLFLFSFLPSTFPFSLPPPERKCRPPAVWSRSQAPLRPRARSSLTLLRTSTRCPSVSQKRRAEQQRQFTPPAINRPIDWLSRMAELRLRLVTFIAAVARECDASKMQCDHRGWVERASPHSGPARGWIRRIRLSFRCSRPRSVCLLFTSPPSPLWPAPPDEVSTPRDWSGSSGRSDELLVAIRRCSRSCTLLTVPASATVCTTPDCPSDLQHRRAIPRRS